MPRSCKPDLSLEHGVEYGIAIGCADRATTGSRLADARSAVLCLLKAYLLSSVMVVGFVRELAGWEDASSNLSKAPPSSRHRGTMKVTVRDHDQVDSLERGERGGRKKGGQSIIVPGRLPPDFIWLIGIPSLRL